MRKSEGGRVVGNEIEEGERERVEKETEREGG